jgi:hypothetical protein
MKLPLLSIKKSEGCAKVSIELDEVRGAQEDGGRFGAEKNKSPDLINGLKIETT